MLKDITFGDVLEELQGRLLSEEEMVACLRWWINASHQDPTGIDDARQQLLDVAHLSIDLLGNGDEQVVSLKGIQTFLNLRNTAIPKDGPLPNHLLPIRISRRFNSAQLQKSLQWRELTALDWVRHLVEPAVYNQGIEFNIIESPFWAEHVLQILSRCWLALLEVDKTSIVELLKELTCIPTSAGMKMPSEAYFSNASIFHDLPIVNLPSRVPIKGALKELLAGLGVQKHVGLEVIYNR